MASSPPPTGKELAVAPSAGQSAGQSDGPSRAESQLSSLVYELSQNVQLAMNNMLTMISEIDQNSAAIKEEMEKSKNSVLQRKTDLEEERDHVQKAAFAVLDMLNSRNTN